MLDISSTEEGTAASWPLPGRGAAWVDTHAGLGPGDVQ
jgi:hypothetical protein